MAPPMNLDKAAAPSTALFARIVQSWNSGVAKYTVVSGDGM